MANTAHVSTTTWVEGASDYGAHLCNPKMQKALSIDAMALELAAVGGTDYTADYESLIAASDALSKWMNPDQLKAAEVAIDYANATGAGASVEATLTLKLENAKKLLCYDEQTLDRARLYLKGALGYHSSF